MNRDHMLHNKEVIARFINGEDFLEEPDREYLKLSHDQRVIRDFVSGSGIFAQDYDMTPLQAIRKVCVNCVGSPFLVKDCGGDQCLNGQGDSDGQCYFFPYRDGKGRPSVRLIRKFCVECMAGDKKLVAECSSRDCPVHLFRLGTNPNFTEATREQRRQRALQHGFGRQDSA